MDPSVLPFQPSGKRFPYFVYVVELAGAEEVLLHKADAVLDRTFAFRVVLSADIQFQILFLAEILKYTCLDDFSICFAGNEHSILIDHQLADTSTKLAE